MDIFLDHPLKDLIYLFDDKVSKSCRNGVEDMCGAETEEIFIIEGVVRKKSQ